MGALVEAKQIFFFSKMWIDRSETDRDPLMHAMRIVLNYNDVVSRDIRDMISNNINDVNIAIDTLKSRITNSNSNKLTFYNLINPQLDVHEIYTKKVRVN